MVPGHDTSADIWSCGCAYLQMLTAKRPWYQLTRPKDDSVEWLRPVLENPAAMVGKEGRVGLLAERCCMYQPFATNRSLTPF